MKTRFCPSPTGFMHLGNVRTALFSALYTRSNNGEFLLRIEDTDAERSDEKCTEAVMRDLHWLGLNWDEGPEMDKGNGPYFQSERQSIYDRYYDELIDAGLAYPCFCSEQELTVARRVQLASGKPPRYAGTCAHLTQEEIDEKLANGLEPTLRFRVPEDQVVEYIDLVKGVQRFNTDDIGDFIIRRGNGTSPFMFCNAIDDSLMEITHVIRGEDHVSNTPKQIMILQALGLDIPRYGHISLIRGLDGGKLSKRHGSSSIQDMRENGILPRTLVNYLARLGHYYEDNDFMTFDELAAKFSVDHLSKSPAKFDEVQLMHWQKLAVGQLSFDEAWIWMGEQVHRVVPEDKKAVFLEAVIPNVMMPDDAFYWAHAIFIDISPFTEEQMAVLREAGKKFFEEALKLLAKTGIDSKAMCEGLKTNLDVKGKNLFMPLRVALTGEMHGPELVHIFELLGTDKLEQRLSYALEVL